MADDKDKEVSDSHIFWSQVGAVLFCVVVGNLVVPGLSGWGRVAYIFAMFQAGAGLGALVAVHHRKDCLGYVPALGSVIAGLVLGAITAATL